MGLFNRKPKGGRIADIIRCDEPSYLIWKWHPEGAQLGKNKRENAIRFGSSLRVKDGSAAVFVYAQNDGTIQDYIVGPFDGALETNNLPVISNIMGFAYAGGSPFQAEVYFINLAEVISVKFAVPYFDIYDPRFLDFGVPTAVRGSINFKITDCKEFIRLHRLDTFSIDDFQRQIRDTVIRCVKAVVANAPEEYAIPVVQIEKKIEFINQKLEEKLKTRLKEHFGVTVALVDIGAIDIDKTSEGYQQLKAVTQDLERNKSYAETEDYIERLRFRRTEDQHTVNKQSQTAAKSNFQVEKGTDEGIAGVKTQSNIRGNIENGDRVSVMPPPVPKIEYNVVVDGKSSGPFDITTLIHMARNGSINSHTLLWKPGMEKWTPLVAIMELSEVLKSIPPIIE